MTISMYAASAPVFKQILTSLSNILDKAEAHVTAKKIDPNALLQARLYPDMLPFIRQVQIACDFSKNTVARLAGAEVPKHEDTEQTFAELKARIATVLAIVESFSPAQIDGSEDRDITTTGGSTTRHFKGQVYLLNYALPHFYFHVTTAYALLRHNGVEIGKKDYIGTY